MPANPIARLIKPDPYQDFFRVLADTLDEAVLVVSADGERVLACNHALLLLSGHSRPEIETSSPAILFPGEAGQQALGQLLVQLDQPIARLEEAPLKTRAGDILLVDLESRPVGTTHSFALITLRPSANRRQEQEGLRAREERLATLAQMADILRQGATSALPTGLALARQLLRATAVAVYRVSPSSPDYILDGALPAEFPATIPSPALKPLHRQTTWKLGERPAHLLHKAARAAGLAALQTCPLGTTTAWVGALVVGWRDPEDIPADSAALMEVVSGLCDAAMQLGQQKAAIAELESGYRSLEAELEGQFIAAGEGLLLLDSDLRIVRANPAAGLFLGYRPAELQGLPIQEVLVGPEDVIATFLDAQGHDREAERTRLTLHRRDGTPFLVHLRAVPVRLPARPRLLILFTDQSERQAIENRTETLAQRAFLGEVTAIFAHEVRNPINNISTGVQLVASRLGKEHAQYEALQRVQKECSRLDQLMGDVLFFARPLELKIEPLDLAELMQRLLARWEPRFNQAGVACHTSYDPQTPRAAADARTLEQIVINLITNAVQAMSGGGTLSVKLGPAANPQGPMVEMKIADTGPGIPAEIVGRIFDPFFTTKKDGTGLGLAISRRILAAHKGSIHVESFADAGTVFTVLIPAASQPTGSQG